MFGYSHNQWQFEKLCQLNIHISILQINTWIKCWQFHCGSTELIFLITIWKQCTHLQNKTTAWQPIRHHSVSYTLKKCFTHFQTNVSARTHFTLRSQNWYDSHSFRRPLFYHVCLSQSWLESWWSVLIWHINVSCPCQHVYRWSCFGKGHWCSNNHSQLRAGTALDCRTGEILPVRRPLHDLLSLHHGSIQVLVDLVNNSQWV